MCHEERVDICVIGLYSVDLKIYLNILCKERNNQCWNQRIWCQNSLMEKLFFLSFREVLFLSRELVCGSQLRAVRIFKPPLESCLIRICIILKMERLILISSMHLQKGNSANSPLIISLQG